LTFLSSVSRSLVALALVLDLAARGVNSLVFLRRRTCLRLAQAHRVPVDQLLLRLQPGVGPRAELELDARRELA